MPELPEVETVRRGLLPAMEGKVIAEIVVRRAGLRLPFPPDLHARLEGRKVSRLTRRAKYLLIHAGRGAEEDILVIHLGMSGRMTVIADASGYEPLKHDHMIIAMKGGQAVAFNDARRFGMAFLIRAGEVETHPAFAALGPEPLPQAFTGKVLQESLARKSIAIKTALLDQRVVAGVGNIYACEALFEAEIDPRTPAKDLSLPCLNRLAGAIRTVLERAIRAGGSSLRDHRQADGTLGYFQHSFRVYDRKGQACPRCPQGGRKKHIIHKITQGGRSTFYCPRCQK